MTAQLEVAYEKIILKYDIHVFGYFCACFFYGNHGIWKLPDRTALNKLPGKQIKLTIVYMEKTAFKMKLKPGFKEEYKRRHDAVWPEILDLIAKDNIFDYSIFLDEETNILFAVHKVSGKHKFKDHEVAHPRNEIIQKWWDYMADIMETNADNSPVMTPLEKMFHMD